MCVCVCVCACRVCDIYMREASDTSLFTGCVASLRHETSMYRAESVGERKHDHMIRALLSPVLWQSREEPPDEGAWRR